MQPNPFKAQPDEHIFTFKEEEKVRRAQEREKLQGTKIWDRSNPVREGTIRKIRTEESEGNTKGPSNTKTEGRKEKISKTDDRFTLVEKKRDMFLMKMMMDIKNNDIQKLEEYARLREDGLECSHKMLEEHLNKFDEFLERNKKDCQDAIRTAELKNKEKLEKQKAVKEINEKIKIVSSQMAKNKELRDMHARYMLFIREDICSILIT